MNTFRLHTRTASQLFIRCLFGAVFVLQVLDLHSTIISLEERRETNKFILMLAESIGLPASVFVVKAMAILSLAYMARTWTKSTGFDAPVASALVVMCLSYVFVVVSNYAG